MALFGIVIEVKEEQEVNAHSPIVVIPSEMMTVTSLSLISFGLIVISPVPVNVSDDKEGHSENASFSNCCDAVRDSDGSQRRASLKCPFFNRCDTVRDGD